MWFLVPLGVVLGIVLVVVPGLVPGVVPGVVLDVVLNVVSGFFFYMVYIVVLGTLLQEPLLLWFYL